MSELKKYIQSIEEKSNIVTQQAPKKFVKAKPVVEDKMQKLNAFIDVIGEVLYNHGLNENKINEIIDDLYKRPKTENYKVRTSNNYNIPMNSFNKPNQNYSNNRSRIPDPVDYANTLLEGVNDQYIPMPSMPQYQQSYPQPQMGNSSQHQQLYQQMTEAGQSYIPTIDANIYNANGAVNLLPMPEIKPMLQNQQPLQITQQIQMDYGSELL